MPSAGQTAVGTGSPWFRGRGGVPEGNGELQMSLFKRFQWLDGGIPSDASPREGVGGGARPRLRTSAVGTTPDGTGACGGRARVRQPGAE